MAVIFALLGISGFIIPSLAMVSIFGMGAFIADIVTLSKKELPRTTKTKAIFRIAFGALLTGIGIFAALLISLNNSIQ